MTLRVIIVDDEALARERIRQMLAREPEVEVLRECERGLEALEAIEDLAPDLVFLDIQMPGLDGFGVLDAVGATRMPLTIFITAHDEHAIRAFEVNAVDYLLKPFDRPRFSLALARARERLAGRDAASAQARMEGLLGSVQGPSRGLEWIPVRDRGRYFLLKADQVQWVEAEGNYARLHAEGVSHLLRQTMASLAERLDPTRFRRIHRSAIVNLGFVESIQPLPSGDREVRMKDGTRLTLSRTHRGSVPEPRAQSRLGSQPGQDWTQSLTSVT